jgi:hypothetical protein
MQGSYAEKSTHLFVDLNEMHLLTKFHAEQRSFGKLKAEKSKNNTSRGSFAWNLAGL